MAEHAIWLQVFLSSSRIPVASLSNGHEPFNIAAASGRRLENIADSRISLHWNQYVHVSGSVKYLLGILPAQLNSYLMCKECPPDLLIQCKCVNYGHRLASK